MTPATERRAQLDSFAILLVVVCSLIWGLGQVAGKVGLQSFSPLIQVGTRSLGAAVLVALWSMWRGVPLLKSDGSLPGGLLAGSLFAAEFACIFIGLQHTSASRLTVFLYLAPFFVALCMPWIAHSERLRWDQWAGLALAFIGVGLAFIDGLSAPASGPTQWLGDALGLAAAVMWAGTTLSIRATRLGSAAPEKVLLYQLGLAGVLLTGAGWLQGQRWPEVIAFWPGLSWLFQTIIVAFVTYLVWFWLVGNYAATKLSSFTLLTPVAGLICGVLILDEPWTWQLVLALVGVAVGIALVNRPAPPAPRA
jgi:drug/metabolite transporter (DMT)-like permease